MLGSTLKDCGLIFGKTVIGDECIRRTEPHWQVAIVAETGLAIESGEAMTCEFVTHERTPK